MSACGVASGDPPASIDLECSDSNNIEEPPQQLITEVRLTPTDLPDSISPIMLENESPVRLIREGIPDKESSTSTEFFTSEETSAPLNKKLESTLQVLESSLKNAPAKAVLSSGRRRSELVFGTRPKVLEEDKQRLRSMSADDKLTDIHEPPKPLVKDSNELQANSNRGSLRDQIYRSQSMRYFPANSFVENMEDRFLRYRPSESSTNIVRLLNGSHPLQSDKLQTAKIVAKPEVMEQQETSITSGGELVPGASQKTLTSESKFIADIPRPVLSSSQNANVELCEEHISETSIDSLNEQGQHFYEGSPLTRSTNRLDKRESEGSQNAKTGESVDTGKIMQEIGKMENREPKVKPLFPRPQSFVDKSKNSFTLETLHETRSSSIGGYQRSPLESPTVSARPLEPDENGRMNIFNKGQQSTSSGEIEPTCNSKLDSWIRYLLCLS